MRDLKHMIDVGAELSEQCKSFGYYRGIELCFYCRREDECEESTALAQAQSEDFKND